jgi:hypothetical protein
MLAVVARMHPKSGLSRTFGELPESAVSSATGMPSVNRFPNFLGLAVDPLKFLFSYGQKRRQHSVETERNAFGNGQRLRLLWHDSILPRAIGESSM